MRLHSLGSLYQQIFGVLGHLFHGAPWQDRSGEIIYTTNDWNFLLKCAHNIFSAHIKVSFLHVYHHFTIAWAWWIGLSTCPFGDAYFGALLNSWIHVMMYSYYAMALLKIPCPFKRYLTMAQLTQFATVVAYSFVCVTMWPSGQRDWRAYTAICTQVWEMVSLFALFSLFYKKSYGNQKKARRKNLEQPTPFGSKVLLLLLNTPLRLCQRLPRLLLYKLSTKLLIVLAGVLSSKRYLVSH